LAGLVGVNVKVTLEIPAEIPSGVPDNVVRIVTEHSRTLKFKGSCVPPGGRAVVRYRAWLI